MNTITIVILVKENAMECLFVLRISTAPSTCRENACADMVNRAMLGIAKVAEIFLKIFVEEWKNPSFE